MKRQDKLSPPRRDRRAHARPQYCWRIGNATVSTEELQAWQLGPAHEAARRDWGAEYGGAFDSGPAYRAWSG
jgi:hypothetical protein